MPAPGENPALDAETRVPILIGVSIAFVLLSVTVVLLRLFTRYAIVKALGSDDFTILIAVVLSIGVSITTILQAEYGLGLHVWMVDQETSMKQLKALFAGEVLYNLAQIITKLSFLLQFRRIFKDTVTRSVCIFFFGFLSVWGVVQEFLVGFACTPIGNIIPDHNTHCIETLVVWYLTSVVNIITDFIIFLTPMPAIKQLQLRRKQKIVVGAIFCLGFFTCIISIVRLCFLRAAINTQDPTWDNVPVSYWSVIELNCGIICASAATLRPLLRKVIPGLRSASEAYRYNFDQMSSNKAATSITHEAPDLYAIPDLASGSTDAGGQRPSGLTPLASVGGDSNFSKEGQSEMGLPLQSNPEDEQRRRRQREVLRPAAMMSVEEELKRAEKAEEEAQEGVLGVKPKAAAMVGLWSNANPKTEGSSDPKGP